LKRESVEPQFTDADLEAYLDESLDSGRAAQIEDVLASDKALLNRLAMINGRRDAGVHTLGEIWRRNQIGVPTPEVMGNFILGILPEGDTQYIQFRMDHLKCCFTLAMFNDLQLQQSENSELSQTRRERIYKTSAGLLKRGNPEEE
tara:strand:+ start:63 stop:500 length:438 start_codon:yes stop_codon:yes gene_type:complete